MSTVMCPVGMGSIMDCSMLMRNKRHTARERKNVFTF